MLGRIVIAVAVGVVVFLGCTLVGTLLGDVNVPFVETIGSFLRTWAAVLGLLAGLVQFFSGRFF